MNLLLETMYVNYYPLSLILSFLSGMIAMYFILNHWFKSFNGVKVEE